MRFLDWLKERRESGETRFERYAYFTVVCFIIGVSLVIFVSFIGYAYKENSEGKKRCEETYKATCYRMWIPIQGSAE